MFIIFSVSYMSEDTKKKDEKKEESLDDLYTHHWAQYVKDMAQERRKKIAEMARKDEFTIGIYDKEKNTWDNRVFKYHEIPTSQWLELEELRSDYSDKEKVAVAVSARLSLTQDVSQIQYSYTKQLNTILEQIYRKSAKYFLGMDEEVYDNSQYTQVKAVIDACNHRTVFTLPNLV